MNTFVTDYSRKGISWLPVAPADDSVRPGKPNLAAPSFASGIIREPLAGGAAARSRSGAMPKAMAALATRVIESLICAFDPPRRPGASIARTCRVSAVVGDMVLSIRCADRRRSGRRSHRNQDRSPHRWRWCCPGRRVSATTVRSGWDFRPTRMSNRLSAGISKIRHKI